MVEGHLRTDKEPCAPAQMEIRARDMRPPKEDKRSQSGEVTSGMPASVAQSYDGTESDSNQDLDNPYKPKTMTSENRR